MSKPYVSVLMPAHNAAATLPETLDSLRAQSMPDFEIVAVNDGSSDNTGEILRALAKEDHRELPDRG